MLNESLMNVRRYGTNVQGIPTLRMVMVRNG